MTPGMPAPSGYNLPYGVSLRDLEGDTRLRCDNCHSVLAESEQNYCAESSWTLCRDCRKERGQE